MKSIEEALGQAKVMSELVESAAQDAYENLVPAIEKDCPLEPESKETFKGFVRDLIRTSYFKGAALGALGITASVLTERLKHENGAEQPQVQDFDVQFFANGVRKVSSVRATSFQNAVERIKSSVKYAGSQLNGFKQLIAA